MTGEKINKIKNLYFEKVNKIDNLQLDSLRNREKFQINKNQKQEQLQQILQKYKASQLTSTNSYKPSNEKTQRT